MWRKRGAPARQRQEHPDSLIESQLKRIDSLHAAITRQEQIAAELREQMAAARVQQDKASNWLRGHHTGEANLEFELNMRTQRERVQDALNGITAAEEFIAARNTEIAELTARLTAVERSYLEPG
jgi:uncharacterized coiled-coil protein SlyX